MTKTTKLVEFISIIFTALTLACTNTPDNFIEIDISPVFRRYLLADTLLMEYSGVKIIPEPDLNRNIVIIVESTALNGDASSSITKAEKILKAKALAKMAEEIHGSYISRTTKLEEKTVTRITNTTEDSINTSQLNDQIRSSVQGHVPGAPTVGKWLSMDRTVFYLAIGYCVDDKGHVFYLD